MFSVSISKYVKGLWRLHLMLGDPRVLCFPLQLRSRNKDPQLPTALNGFFFTYTKMSWFPALTISFKRSVIRLIHFETSFLRLLRLIGGLGISGQIHNLLLITFVSPFPISSHVPLIIASRNILCAKNCFLPVFHQQYLRMLNILEFAASWRGCQVPYF